MLYLLPALTCTTVPAEGKTKAPSAPTRAKSAHARSSRYHLALPRPRGRGLCGCQHTPAL